MTKTIFWNVDTQRDFMEPTGKLAVPGAMGIVPNLRRLTAYAREHGITVVSTRDWHTFASREFSETPDFTTTFPPHCIMWTPGAEYLPATRPINAYEVDWRADRFDEQEIRRQHEIIIDKDAFDVFAGNPHTSRIVETLEPKRAVVYGVATNYCVNYAVQGLLERGVEVYVVSDAIEAIRTPDGQVPAPDGTVHPTTGQFYEREWTPLGVHLTATDSIDRVING